MPVKFLQPTDHSVPVLAYSNRQNGNMSFSKGSMADVTANRAALAKEMGVDASDFMTFPHTGSNSLLVIHEQDVITKNVQNYYQNGGQIICNTSKALYRHPRLEDGFDAVVSNKRDLFPLVIVGDCVGAQLIDVVNHSFAIVHAGLSGCINNVVPHALQAMQTHFGSKPENIHAILPPSIRSCHYEVERLAIYQSPAVQKLILADPRQTKNNFYDLHATIKHQLCDFGVNKANICDIPFCTVCHPEFFYSNFLAGKKGTQATEGRFASTIGLKSPR